MRCSPAWRCLRYGCHRCDQQRERDRVLREERRKLTDFVRERKLFDSIRTLRPPDDQRFN